MEAYGNFYGIYSWKLQLMEAMEGSISTVSGNYRVFPWKHPLTSMKVYLLALTSMEINLLRPTSVEFSMEKKLFPPSSMGVSVKVKLLPRKLPWKLVENYMEVNRKSEIMWRALLLGRNNDLMWRQRQQQQQQDILFEHLVYVVTWLCRPSNQQRTCFRVHWFSPTS